MPQRIVFPHLCELNEEAQRWRCIGDVFISISFELFGPFYSNCLEHPKGSHNVPGRVPNSFHGAYDCVIWEKTISETRANFFLTGHLVTGHWRVGPYSLAPKGAVEANESCKSRKSCGHGVELWDIGEDWGTSTTPMPACAAHQEHGGELSVRRYVLRYETTPQSWAEAIALPLDREIARASRHQPLTTCQKPEGAVFIYEFGPAVRGCDAEPEWQRGGCASRLGRGLVY